MSDIPATESTAEPTAAESPATEAAATESAPVPEASQIPAARRRAVRKPSKPDAVLAAAVGVARAGVLEIAREAEVGDHLGAVPEAERLVTHRFASNVPGYVGWQWFATLARVPRGKDATVCEVGLLPSPDSLLAPDWVPWAERVRPEDTALEEGEVPDVALAEGEAAEAVDEGAAPAEELAPPAPGGQAESVEIDLPSASGGESPVA